VTGSGGCGKTRLALRVAEQTAERFRNCVSGAIRSGETVLAWHSLVAALHKRQDAVEKAIDRDGIYMVYRTDSDGWDEWAAMLTTSLKN